MFISATKARRKSMAQTGFAYLLAALFCACFGAAYEYYSHEVYSGYMIYAFLFPLAFGALPFVALSIRDGGPLPGRLPVNLYNAGIAALTVGSVMEGALEIYGTTNDMLRLYWLVGGGLAGSGLLLYGYDCIKSREAHFKESGGPAA